MTDKALENAERERDLLAAEINSLAQRTEKLKREIAKIDDWIAQWHEFAGKDEAERSRWNMNLRRRQPGQHGPKATHQRKRLRLRLKS